MSSFKYGFEIGQCGTETVHTHFFEKNRLLFSKKSDILTGTRATEVAVEKNFKLWSVRYVMFELHKKRRKVVGGQTKYFFKKHSIF